MSAALFRTFDSRSSSRERSILEVSASRTLRRLYSDDSDDSQLWYNLRHNSPIIKLAYFAHHLPLIDGSLIVGSLVGDHRLTHELILAMRCRTSSRIWSEQASVWNSVHFGSYQISILVQMNSEPLLFGRRLSMVNLLFVHAKFSSLNVRAHQSQAQIANSKVVNSKMAKALWPIRLSILKAIWKWFTTSQFESGQFEAAYDWHALYNPHFWNFRSLIRHFDESSSIPFLATLSFRWNKIKFSI